MSSGTNIYNCDYSVGRPVNVAGGRDQGIEISFQKPIWDGFGVIANYTFSDAKSNNGRLSRSVSSPWLIVRSPSRALQP